MSVVKRRSSPWLGRRRDLDGQRFECVAVEHVRSRAGRSVPVLRWRSACTSCGAAFDFRTCRRPRDGYMVRRCRLHLPRPGRGRALRRPGRAAPTPGLLDLLVAEDPDGTLVTMAGEVIRRPASRGPALDFTEAAVRRLLAAERANQPSA